MTDQEQLRKKLNGFKGRFPAIAQEARVSYSWLCKFAAGKIPCPRADTQSRLLAALDESK